MAAEYCRKSGQIPAFGDWDYANEMPITQYFDCARQAGLLRCSCSGECGGAYAAAAAYGGGDLYGNSLPRRVHAAPNRKVAGIEKKCRHSKEQRKQVKVRDIMDQPRKQQQPQKQTRNLVQNKSSITVKPVDEDLYKIPPELLDNSKRKKMLGFFSKCMVPPCAA